MRTTTDPFLMGLARGLRPKPRMSLSQWAQDHVVLSENSSARGPYRPGDAAYQPGMMDAITDPDVQGIVFVTSSQVGKTLILLAAMGYFAEAEPSPQLVVLPDLGDAEKFKEERFDRMVEDGKDLKKLFKGNSYPGGEINFVGARNAKDLASRAIRVVTGDEIDRWTMNSTKEGSPITLLRRRMTTFFNRKEILVSTPVYEANSAIVAEFKTCRQFYYHVVCDDCSTAQIMRWEDDNGRRVIFEKGKEDQARYACAQCGSLWTDLRRRRLVREAPQRLGGGWREMGVSPFKCFQGDIAPDRARKGFWINALYSPWTSLAEIAREFSLAEGNPEKLKGFTNTTLGLPWRGDVSSFADWEMLFHRREVYDPRVCPMEAVLITAAVDVQDDRVEILFIAWGAGEECWLLNHEVVRHDPSTPRAWAEVTEHLLRQYPHPTGRLLSAEAVCIDSGGHFTQVVYGFAMRAEKQGRNWHAIRGVPGQAKPIWKLSQEKLKKGVKLWLVGVDDAKSTIYARYAIKNPGEGHVHLHAGITEALAKQMTAEVAELSYNEHGFPVRAWANPQRARNELLDLMVYNLAARSSLAIDIDQRLRNMLGPQAPALPSLEEVGRMYRQ